MTQLLSSLMNSFRRDAPGVMDLILLSTEPIQIPLNLASVQNMIKSK